jgi:hypothetical protein
MTNDTKIIYSPLSGSFTQEGITVQVHIYRLDRDTDWVLEVVDADDTSTVWEEKFETDKAAHEFFLASVETEGLAQVISDDYPTLH